MPGQLKVGGNVIAEHTGVEGAGTVQLQNLVFPAGHIIRTFYDERVYTSYEDITTSSTVYDNLEITISSPLTSDIIQVFFQIPDVYCNSVAGRALRVGLVYSTDNWSTNSQLGSSEFIYGRASQPSTDVVITAAVGSLRLNHPTSSDYKIKLKLQARTGTVQIAHDSQTVPNLGCLYAYEIKG